MNTRKKERCDTLLLKLFFFSFFCPCEALDQSQSLIYVKHPSIIYHCIHLEVVFLMHLVSSWSEFCSEIYHLNTMTVQESRTRNVSFYFSLSFSWVRVQEGVGVFAAASEGEKWEEQLWKENVKEERQELIYSSFLLATSRLNMPC